MTKTSSRASVPLLIEGDNVSEAYCKLLLHIANNPGLEVSPLVLTVDGFPADYSVPEDSAVRSTLDALLAKKQKTSVEDVAFTIFPQQLWTMAQGDRAKLFQFYRWSFPFYRARHKANPRACGLGLPRPGPCRSGAPPPPGQPACGHHRPSGASVSRSAVRPSEYGRRGGGGSAASVCACLNGTRAEARRRT